MRVNHVTTADGEELINLMSDTVSEINLLENETAHAANGEAIVGKAKYINPNLLDNPDLSINQMGQTEYTSMGYTVDRWRSNSARVSKKVRTNGGMQLYCNTGTWGWLLYQTLEVVSYQTGVYTANINVSELLGESWKFVASVYDADNKVITESGKYILKTGNTSFTLSIPEGAAKVNIGLYAAEDTKVSSGDYIDVEWVKLEPGTVATPFVPPNPAVELAKCQRYLYKIPSVSRYRSTHLNSKLIDFAIPVPTSMRTLPSLSGEMLVTTINGGTRYDDFTFSANFDMNGAINVRATKEEHGLTDALLVFDGPAFLSAEL